LVFPNASRVVRPTVGIQPAIAEILIQASMELVAASAGDEVELRGGLAETGVEIELVGLNRHLLDVFKAGRNSRLSVAAELHAGGAAGHAVNVVALVGQGKAVEGPVSVDVAVAGHQLGQGG